jgi:plasmid stabilization system protein ParE
VAQNRVIWSASALADVEAIAAYIARDSEHYASVVVERMLEAASLILPSAAEWFRNSPTPQFGRYSSIAGA